MGSPHHPKGSGKKIKHITAVTQAQLAKMKAHDVLQRTYGNTAVLGHGAVHDAKQATGATVVVLSPFRIDEALWLGSQVVGGGS